MVRIVEALFHDPKYPADGANDKLLPTGWAKDIADQIPQSRSAVVGAAGHCPQLEQPADVKALLVDFLADIQG